MWGGEEAVALAETAAQDLITVVHYTSEEFAAAIEESGFLRTPSYVTVLSDVWGMTASEVEATLEITEGRGRCP